MVHQDKTIELIDFDAYRRKYLVYLPDGRMKHLLIGESPPNQRRAAPWFFYYDEDDAEALGGLFEHTMRARYEHDWKDLPWTREGTPTSKRILLKKFSSEGFYLIDETDEIIAGSSRPDKRKALKSVKESKWLVNEIADLANDGYVTRATKIAFISTMGYDRLFDHLRAEIIAIGPDQVKLSELLMDRRVPLPFGNLQNVADFKEFIGSLPPHDDTS